MTTAFQTVHDAARSYLFACGRALDQARYNYFFEETPPQAVLDALTPYRNPDGGFGNALEPDIRTPASSVIATLHALEILEEIHAPDTEPLVQSALAYLLTQYDAQAHVWPMVTPAVEDAPHAPWWTYTGTAAAFDGFRINPTAAVVAHLWLRRHQLDDSAWLAQLLPIVAERIAVTGSGMDLNALHTALALHAVPDLPGDIHVQLTAALTEAVPAIVATDSDAWTGYTMQPLDAAPAPDSFAAALLPATALRQNLDYWTGTQLDDGSWPVPWQWSFIDPDAWAQAEQDWKGNIIVRRLRTLAAYDDKVTR